MEYIRELGVIAARLLLLHILDPSPRTTEEEMTLVGCNRRQTFYAARGRLVELKLLERRGYSAYGLPSSVVGLGSGVEGVGMGVQERKNLSFFLDPGGSRSTSAANGRDNQDTTESDATESVTQSLNTTESVIYPQQIQQKVLHDTTESVVSVADISLSDTTESVVSLKDITESVVCRDIHTTESVVSSPNIQQKVLHEDQLTLLERIEQADLMDASGSESGKGSGFQARRKVQIALMVEAWSEIFPEEKYPLNPENAKKLISWCGNSAESAYWSVMDIRDRYHPKAPTTYVLKTMKSKYDKGEIGVRVEAPKPVPTTSVVEGSGAWDGEQHEPSLEWRKKFDQAQKYYTGWGE